MMRWSLIGVAVVLALAGVLVTGAGATKVGIKATLTRGVQPGPPGSRVAVAWKLRDASGRAVRLKHVFVRLTCPEGDRSTTTYANPGADGVYVVRAIVPAGGVGSINLGHGGSTFPITNPYHA